MLLEGESTPNRDCVKPPGSCVDHGVDLQDKEKSNDDAGTMRQEVKRLRKKLSSLKSYCGNLEAEKYTLQDELSTFRHELDVIGVKWRHIAP